MTEAPVDRTSPLTRRVLTAISFAGLIVVVTTGIVLAQEQGQLDGKLLSGPEVTIPAGQTVDHDLYVFGGALTSHGTINGDVVAVGGSAVIDGPVNGDILAAGGTITLGGQVGGDVRAAGGQIDLTGNVAQDVLAAGGHVTISGQVGQDLIVSGGQLTLTGTVNGGAAGSVGSYTKSGTVAGTDSITITGGRQAPFVPPPSDRVLDAIRQFIAVMLIGLVWAWLAPRSFATAEAEIRTRPVESFVWGIAMLVGYIVVVVALVVIVIVLAIILGLLGFGGLLVIDLFGGFVTIAGVTLAFIVAFAFLADAIVGLALGRWVAGLAGRPARDVEAPWTVLREPGPLIGWLAIGVAIIVVLTALPIVGAWVKLVVALLGLGALMLTWRRSRAVPPAATATAPPVTPTPAAG